MTQFKMLLPLLVVAGGLMLLGLRKGLPVSGRTKKPVLLPPNQRAQARIIDAIDLKEYPARTRLGEKGQASFVKDWSEANLRTTIAFLMPHVRGAIVDPKVGAPFKSRAAWLLRAMEDFLRRP